MSLDWEGWQRLLSLAWKEGKHELIRGAGHSIPGGVTVGAKTWGTTLPDTVRDNHK